MAHFYRVADHMRILLLLAVVASTVEAEAQDIQIRVHELPPPTTFAGLRQLRGPMPSGPCAFPAATLLADSLNTIAVGDSTTLRFPRDWRTRPLLPEDDEYTHVRLATPEDNRVRIQRERNGARGRSFLMYLSGERPEGATCTVDRGQAGAIWSFYPPDPQDTTTGSRKYAALGAVITPAGFWYSVSLSTLSAADQSRLASILTEAMLLPLR
jgi:hypothetical protein